MGFRVQGRGRRVLGISGAGFKFSMSQGSRASYGSELRRLELES